VLELTLGAIKELKSYLVCLKFYLCAQIVLEEVFLNNHSFDKLQGLESLCSNKYFEIVI
jgi:hypothetical protein